MVTDYALDSWRRWRGLQTESPSGFVTASEPPIAAHIRMLAALQPFAHNSISKRLNVPENTPFEEVKRIYDMAYDMGLKGCTTFRKNPVTGAIMREQADGNEVPRCCVAERDAD